MVRYRLGELMAEKRSREGRRITADEISKATGIHPATLSRLQAGRGYNTTIEVLEKLCHYFDVALTDLVVISKKPKIKRS